jgi:hypothetical protein
MLAIFADCKFWTILTFSGTMKTAYAYWHNFAVAQLPNDMIAGCEILSELKTGSCIDLTPRKYTTGICTDYREQFTMFTITCTMILPIFRFTSKESNTLY